MPSDASQLPSCVTEPTRYTLSPYEVVTSSLKVTATAVADAHDTELVVVADADKRARLYVELIAVDPSVPIR